MYISISLGAMYALHGAMYEAVSLVTDEPIHLALLLPVSGSWDVGTRVAGAAALAVERVNADLTLLPGRKLEYSWADSGCSAQQGLTAIGELLARQGRIDAVIGPGCSTACEVTSYLSGGQNIAQVQIFLFFALCSVSNGDAAKFKISIPNNR